MRTDSHVAAARRPECHAASTVMRPIGLYDEGRLIRRVPFQRRCMPASKVHPAGAAAPAANADASRLIDEKIAALDDWRSEMLARLRAIIKATDPDVVEEWKWRGTPVWSHDGLICTGETYKSVVKTTFAKGASLPDPSRLFNSSLDGNVRRAIDFHQGDKIDEQALKALVRAAVALNQAGRRR
jgi:hypothetical protein